MISESLTLRPYQLAALDELRARARAGARRLVVVAPTGAGKTVIASELARSSLRLGRRVLVLAHRRELITQAVDKLARAGITPGVIMAGARADPTNPVQVASVQTLTRRELAPADLVIVDECHHSVSPSWRAILSEYPNAFIVGLTATPWRTDRVGLADLYQGSVLAATPAELIAGGALCPYEAYAYDAPDLHAVKVTAGEYNQGDLGLACNTSVLIGGVVGEYHRHTPGRRALVFACSVEHSQAIAAEFGPCARHVDFRTPTAERERAIADLAAGRLLILCSVSLFAEGFDCPAVEVCILARPTLSLSLHLQMVGRGMRPSPGKRGLVIHDHAGNLLRHGLPDDERSYELSATPARVHDLNSCPFCRAACRPLDDGTCPKCHEIIAPPREVREANARARKEQLEGERIAAEEIRRRRREQAAAAPEAKKRAYYERLRAEAAEKGYKPGWVGVRFQAVFGHWPRFTREAS